MPTIEAKEPIEAKHRDIALKNILLATDFSETSERALQAAAAIARRYDSHLVIAHIVTPEVYPIQVPETVATVHQICLENAYEQVKKLRASPVLTNVRHTEIVREGYVWEQLAEIIKKQQIDVVVLGTHGSKGIEKLLLGSVAEQIFRMSPRPVLTIGPQVPHDAALEAKLNTILYATDFSPPSIRAVPYALALAEQDDAKLIVLHVETKLADRTHAGREVLRRRLVSELEKMLSHYSVGRAPRYEIAFGDVVESILQVAVERRANLVVLGVQHERELANHAPWSVASKIVRQAKCPVLTVRDL